VKQEEEEESVPDDSEAPSSTQCLSPFLQNAQGYGSYIYSDYLKSPANVKNEWSDYPGSLCKMCVDNIKESSCNHKQRDSHMEDSKPKVDMCIFDYSKYTQSYSNKSVKMDPIVKLSRLELSVFGLKHLGNSQNEVNSCNLSDSKSSVQTEIISNIKGASVVKTVAEFPTEQDILQHPDCLNSVGDSGGKINIRSHQRNKCSTQKKVNVDHIEELSKGFSEHGLKQHLSGFSPAVIPEQEMVSHKPLTRKHMDRNKIVTVENILKQSRRLSSNYKLMKCVCDCNTGRNVKEKRDIHKPRRSRCRIQTDENKRASVDMVKKSKRLSSNCKAKHCFSDSNSAKNAEDERNIMRPQGNCKAKQKKTVCRPKSRMQNIQKKIVKADKTVKVRNEFSSKYHIKQHSGALIDDTPYRCDKCKKKYATSRGLQDHYMFHTGSRPFVCKVCAKMFPTLVKLVKHIQRHSREKPYECQLCDKKFRFLMSLKTHILFHTGEKPFECILCNKRFFTSHDLKNHIHIHTGEKPFVCKLCWKGFSSAASLRKHRFHHARGKPYFCKSCSMQFERYRLFMQHIETHKIKKYECSECHKMFSSLELIKKHALTHLNVRPYSCPLCNGAFLNSASLMCHYRSHRTFYPQEIAFAHVEEGTE
jgi:KRAB domain-containing zinc finger protein